MGMGINQPRVLPTPTGRLISELRRMHADLHDRKQLEPIFDGYICSTSAFRMETLESQNAKLLAACKDLLIILEHGPTPPPNHICGSPDARCDCDCMNYARECEMIRDAKQAISDAERTDND